MSYEWVFTYGTLQPGFVNWRALAPICTDSGPWAGTRVRGTVYYAFDRDSYPVADFSAEGEIWGTALLVDTSSGNWWAVEQMELNAWFDREKVVDLDTGREMKAFGVDIHRWFRGSEDPLLVPEGNWAKHTWRPQ